MSSNELTEWMAYYGLEPIGELRADLREASHMALIANINRDRKKRRAFTYEDFILKFEGDITREAHQQKMLTKVEMLNMQFGGKDLREV